MLNKVPPVEVLVGGAVFIVVAVGLLFVLPGADTSEMSTYKTETVMPYVEIVNPSGFVNTPAITLNELVGEKVILIDFVTYSCINCQRTFPYLNQWYDAYKDEGFEIVAIHTPEFAFERDIENVRRAAEKFGLKFPIVLDNDYATWGAYKNRYWPRKYLIDIHGNIVYDHIGEGAYGETEEKIVELLNERKQVLGERGVVAIQDGVPEGVQDVDFAKVGTPETYLGAARIQYLINLPNQSCLEGSCTYSFTNADDFQGYELMGAWKLDQETAKLDSQTGAIRIAFTASKVNLVAGAPEGKEIRAKVFVDGVQTGVVKFTGHDLYTLVDLEGQYGSHILEIQFEDPGIAAFAFTFG